MSDPRAFISFDVDHNSDEKVLFAGQSKNSKTPFSIQDWSAKSSMPQSQWEAIVKEKINVFVRSGFHFFKRNTKNPYLTSPFCMVK